jgi:hypothetical protein
VVVKAGMSAAEEEEEEEEGEVTKQKDFWRNYCEEIRAFLGAYAKEKNALEEGFAKALPIWVTDRGVEQFCRSPSRWVPHSVCRGAHPRSTLSWCSG